MGISISIASVVSTHLCGCFNPKPKLPAESVLIIYRLSPGPAHPIARIAAAGHHRFSVMNGKY
jgi:hypothetical protein